MVVARWTVDIGGIGGRESHRHSLAAQKATVEAGFNARKKRLRMEGESRPAKRRIVRSQELLWWERSGGSVGVGGIFEAARNGREARGRPGATCLALGSGGLVSVSLQGLFPIAT